MGVSNSHKNPGIANRARDLWGPHRLVDCEGENAVNYVITLLEDRSFSTQKEH
jgi:hypothetical protein